MNLLISIGKILSALFFTVVGWPLSRLKATNERAKTAEEDEKELAQALKSQTERERSHEKRVEEIASDHLSDDRVSELLSTYPPENTETTSPPHLCIGVGASPALRKVENRGCHKVEDGRIFCVVEIKPLLQNDEMLKDYIEELLRLPAFQAGQ